MPPHDPAPLTPPTPHHPDRRRVVTLTLAAAAAPRLVLGPSLSEEEAADGVRAALAKASATTVQLLGRTDAFMGNPKVRVNLPRVLDDAAQMLQGQGQRRLVGELVTAMNRAAEASMPDAAPLFADAVKTLKLDDAMQLLTGVDRAATRYFEHHVRGPIAEGFAPIIARTAERVRLVAKYDAFASAAASMQLLSATDTKLVQYVARKALDSVFLVIGDHEVRFRTDPTSTGSAALRRVFEAVK